MDRDKVIKGLTCCREDNCDGSSCPYATDLTDCIERLADDALNLLEPVSPNLKQDENGIFALCGNCNRVLWTIFKITNKGVRAVNTNDISYCPYCGRKIKYEKSNS